MKVHLYRRWNRIIHMDTEYDFVAKYIWYHATILEKCGSNQRSMYIHQNSFIEWNEELIH